MSYSEYNSLILYEMIILRLDIDYTLIIISNNSFSITNAFPCYV